MKDPTSELIQEVYDALSGNVTYSGNTVPVYDRVIEYEDLTLDYYIRLGEASMTEDGSKDKTITRGTLEVYVITFFTGKNEGTKDVKNSISNQIGQLIDQSFSLTNFTQILGRVSDITDLDYELDPQGIMFGKLITYEYIIQET